MDELLFNEKVYFYVKFILNIFLSFLFFIFAIFAPFAFMWEGKHTKDDIINIFMNLFQSMYLDCGKIGLIIIIIIFISIFFIVFYYIYIYPIVFMIDRINKINKLTKKQYQVLNIPLIEKDIRTYNHHEYFYCTIMVLDKKIKLEIKRNKYLELNEGENIKILLFDNNEKDCFIVYELYQIFILK